MTTRFRKILLEIDPDWKKFLPKYVINVFQKKIPNKIYINVCPGSVTSDINSEMDLFSDSDAEEDFYMMDYENTTQSELKCLTICSMTKLFEDHLLLKTSDE